MSTRPRQSIANIPIGRLLEHPNNVRDDLGDLTELAQSMREVGILQPLTATEHAESGGMLLLLAGHRRLGAARLAGLTSVPVIIRHGVTDVTDHRVLMLVENTQRRDLNPMERAEAYGALQATGLSVAEIARRTGTRPQTVRYYQNLLLLPQHEREEIRTGVRPAHATIHQMQADRQADRVAAEKKPRGRPPGAKTKPYFGTTHPLANAARALCGHRGRPHIGSVACGSCWEQAIRDDAGQTTTTEAKEPTQ